MPSERIPTHVGLVRRTLPRHDDRMVTRGSDYLAATYSEEVLKLALVAARSLMGGLTSLPTTNSVAHVLFNIPPMRPMPVTLELSLTPNAALYYEIEGGPLRVTAPSGTNSSAEAWAGVRSTGKQTIGTTGQTRQLSPPLVFQAKVVTSGAETLAYGQKCRTSDAAVEAAKKLVDTWRSK